MFLCVKRVKNSNKRFKLKMYKLYNFQTGRKRVFSGADVREETFKQTGAFESGTRRIRLQR